MGDGYSTCSNLTESTITLSLFYCSALRQEHKQVPYHAQKHHIETGGLGFYFYSKGRNRQCPCGFVWVRRSGTEPVVRLIADAVGESAAYLERALIEVWRSIVGEACSQA